MAFADIAHYRKGSLDNYDTVITLGDHQNEPIRKVEHIRRTPEKRLIPLGLPYMDKLFVKSKEQANSFVTEENARPVTVLVASSWGSKGLLAEYGTAFINDLSRWI